MPDSNSIENQVRDALRRVRYPEVTKDIVASGQLRRVEVTDGEVVVHVDLPTMVVPAEVRSRFEAEVRAAAETAAGGKPVRLEATVRVASLPKPADKALLPGVKNVVAVASGKGGVGKSTVAVNLALALKNWGARVGVLDADVFGPSIPQMLGSPEKPPGSLPPNRITPAVYYGMQVLSMGFFIEPGEAVVWRGPMVHKLLEQFLGDVEWGELDYLVVDLPPGTGDVQLSLSQLVALAGAVMVTTPQEVAVIDVVKGMAMFRKVEVPLLGVVENMAYFVCPGCGHHEEIFSRGGGKRLAEQEQVPFLGEIPIETRVRVGGDVGMPIVQAAPESSQAHLFAELAVKVAGRIAANVLSGPRRSASLVAIK